MDPMAIGLVTTGFDKGGLEQIVFSLYQGYRRAGIKAYILCQDRQPDAHFVSQLHDADDICFFGEDFEAFISFCYQKRITHLHYHFNTCFIQQAKQCGIHTLYTIHNMYSWLHDSVMRSHGEEVRHCDRIVAVSSLVKNYFCARTGIEPERVDVVGNGVNVAALTKSVPLPERLTRSGLHLGPDDVVFAQVASYAAMKHQIGLVGVMERVIKTHPNAKLLLVGNVLEEDYYQELIQAKNQSPARDNILLVDYMDHKYMGAFLRETVDVAVLASLQEGFGNVIAEAVACKTPMVLTKVGCAPDVQAPGIILADTAYQDLCTLTIQDLSAIARQKECDNTEALANGFICALNDLDALKQKAQGWDTLIETLSVGHMTDSYLDILKTCGEGCWAHDSGAQREFLAKVACLAMPDFLKEGLRQNSWGGEEIGCGGGEGTAYLAARFPSCRFTGVNPSAQAIQAASRHENCRFITVEKGGAIPPADVVFYTGGGGYLADFGGLMGGMCTAAGRYIVLLLPLGEPIHIDGRVYLFTPDTFPLHVNGFYLESYSVIDCARMEDSLWPGEQVLLVYTNSAYRPEQTTLRGIYDKDQRLAALSVQAGDRLRALEAERQKNALQAGRIAELTGQAQALEAALSDERVRQESRVAELTQQAQTLADERVRQEERTAQLTHQAQTLEALLGQEKEALQRTKAELHAKGETLKSYQQLLWENQLAIAGAYETVSAVQQSKGYRVSLLLKRIKFQFLKGTWAERKDFLRWAWAKLRGKVAGRPLQEFDHLVSPLSQLWLRSERNNQSMQFLQGQSITGILPKASRQFFIFASVPFYDVGGGQRSAQLANALNAMGYEVHYIYGFDSSESKRETMYLPTIKHLHIDNYSLDQLSEDIRPDAVLIFEIPYGKFIPYLDYANENGYATIYEHIDNWDSSLGCLFYNRDDFKYFIDTVQHITVTARVLGEKIEEVGRTDYLYSANAVDSSLFEPTRTYEKPADLVIGKRTLLYFGSLWGEWFDWDLLIYVAKNVDCAINLIGDYQPIADKLKTLPANLHFLGIKKHDDLPAYLSYSDIALLPFKKSVIGKYVSPLKIFEYIAMNKPVLATPLDDIAGYPNVVLSEDKEEWARAVRQGIPVRDSTIFTAENSWYARCNQLLDLVGREEKAPYPSISIIILNRNNMKVILRCVSSLLAFSDAYDYEIVVVDNDSTDGSYERLQEEFAGRIKLLKNEKNGCSSGRNLGVAASSGEMLLFLDSDQWVICHHYMDAALDLLGRDSTMGAVAWNAGWFDPNACTGPIVDYLPNRGISAPWILCRTDIAYLATSGFLMRRSLFDEIGGFDEFYDPTCFEDTDLSLKIRHAGYELGYCPYMTFMHLPHQTTQSGSAAHTKLMARNAKYFSEKWKGLDPDLLDYHL